MDLEALLALRRAVTKRHFGGVRWEVRRSHTIQGHFKRMDTFLHRRRPFRAWLPANLQEPQVALTLAPKGMGRL